MDELTFLEDQARRNAAFSLDNLDKLNQRVNALLALLLGGAGGAGAYALGQIGKPGSVWMLSALGALSIWWFILAAWVAMRAMRTREVRAPANDGLALLRHLRGPLMDYINQARQAGESPKDGLTLLREGELEVLHDTAAIYRAASDSIATVLDRVYVCAAASPVMPVVALGLTKLALSL